MNYSLFHSILAKCDQVLSESKNGNEKAILSSAAHNLKYSLHMAKQTAKEKRSSPQSSSMDAYACNADEVSLLCEGCRQTLLFESKSPSTQRNSKCLRLCLELTTALFNCGFIPLEISLPNQKPDSEKRAPFMSKLLGPVETAGHQVESEGGASSEGCWTLYESMVDSVVSVIETVNSKMYPERLINEVICTISACIAPVSCRSALNSALSTSRLVVRGAKLHILFRYLMHFVQRSEVQFTLADECVNNVCSAVVKAQEDFLSAAQPPKLSLEEDVLFLLNETRENFEKAAASKKYGHSKFKLFLKCFCGIIESEKIVSKCSDVLVSYIRGRVLPLLLEFKSDDAESFGLLLRVVRNFCRSDGAFKAFYCARSVFQCIYFPVFSSPSPEKQILVCNELRYQLRIQDNVLGLFLQRDGIAVDSLLEKSLEYLSMLAAGKGRLSSYANKSDPMGVLPSIKYDNATAFLPSRIQSVSDQVQREAALSITDFVTSLSKMMKAKREADDTPIDGFVLDGDGFAQLRNLKEVYNNFILLFNIKKNPQEALSYMEQHWAWNGSLVGTDNAAQRWKGLALLLRNSAGNLNKVVLGEYFSKSLRNDEIQGVFKEWIHLFDFASLPIDEALRGFLSEFKLVGEAQVVDKTMELFAAHYCSQNANAFPSVDLAFILSFSICMLNTDAHSPHVKNRMTLDEFFQNNRGIDDGKDIERGILEGIYSRISQREIVLSPDNTVMSSIPIERTLSDNEVSIQTKLTLSDELCELTKWSCDKNWRVIWTAISSKICLTLMMCIEQAICASENTSSNDANYTLQYVNNEENNIFYMSMRSGLLHSIHLCTKFHLDDQMIWLMETMYSTVNLCSIVSFQDCSVSIAGSLSPFRLELLTLMMNVFRVYGNYCCSRCWQIGFSVMSLLDAVANGLDGMWYRRSCQADRKIVSKSASPDIWFGDLNQPPRCVTAASLSPRYLLLTNLREASSTSSVDSWVENLFDVTRYQAATQIEVTKGLIHCCSFELDQKRSFSFSKFVEFINICVSSTSLEQWLDLWSTAKEVFVSACQKMRPEIVTSALDGLLVIVLVCLKRNFDSTSSCWQEELLQPLEDIFLSAKEDTKIKVLRILFEVEREGATLQGGWAVLLTCATHAARINGCDQVGWNIVRTAVCHNIKKAGTDFAALMNCISEYQLCSDEKIALEAVSLTMGSGRWIECGLDSSFEDWTCIALANWGSTPYSQAELAPPLSDTGSRWTSLFSDLLKALSSTSVRVRAHSICCLWCLFEKCSSCTSCPSDVLLSIFNNNLVPSIKQIIRDVPDSGLEVFDSIDYRMLVQLSLRGMLCAGAKSMRSEILDLVCFAFTDLLSDCPLTLPLIENDLVYIVISVLQDLVAGIASGVSVPPFVNGALPSATRRREHLNLNGFFGCDLDPPFTFWIQDYKRTAPFDFMNSTRSMQWAEVHQSSTVCYDFWQLSEVSADSPTKDCHSTLRRCVLRALAVGLLNNIHNQLIGMIEPHIRSHYILAMRQTLLACCEYTIRTTDIEGLTIVSDAMHLHYSLYRDSEAELQSGNRSIDWQRNTQMLSVVPMICGVMEIAVKCCPLLLENPQADDNNFVSLAHQVSENFLKFLVQSRSYCMEAQHHSSLDGSDGTPMTFSGFASVFPSCEATFDTPGIHQTLRQFYEYSYLVHVVVLKLLLTIQPISVLLSCIPPTVLLDLTTELPSVLEETVATAFLRCCWKAVGLAEECPKIPVLVEWIQSLKDIVSWKTSAADRVE